MILWLGILKLNIEGIKMRNHQIKTVEITMNMIIETTTTKP